ncbi:MULTISPECIES: cupin domain-containing protein [unclassified Coleofasciculus]|uniref:cupin domain-containing protein n=1 Tax=unclassified Coleofasciculus TaxID=2692782 RepID=UPI00187FACDA|nr:MULTISPECIES: cupin domain-containing protein [unclassified Coleofasciculus]MBE9128983.1 cupin domain-containing protein [Coleofasciculus sp. LEGE 07081]MBE9148981.1 cupin domain-containing protein [Coleofasciculus sp. LEGE 07092]
MDKLDDSQLMNVASFAVCAADVHWEPHPIPGVKVAKLYVDMEQRQLSALAQLEAGVHYPLHRHAGVEEVFLLEGDLVVGQKKYEKGDYIRSAPGSTHNPHTEGGCLFFLRTSLDDEILSGS